MASIRTARALAAVAAVPLVLGAGGVAQADDFFPFGNNGNGTVIGDDLDGISSTVQQSAIGDGASNESNAANVNKSGHTGIDQSDKVYTVIFDD